MTTKPLFLCGCIALLSFTFVGTATAADEQTLRDADAEWSKAAGAKDLDKTVSYYSDDAIVMPPNDPAATTKEAVRKIWQDLLGLEQIGVTDNFFELGGHSLLATQIVSRVQSSLKLEISVRQIFEAPTIRQLSGLLDEMTVESEELARIVAMVEEMTDEQVRLQLEQSK